MRCDNQRPEFHGCKFFGLTEWKQLLDVESGTTFDEASILRASEIVQPLSKVALTGEIRRIADVRNLELQSPRGERFHRVYRGEHIRTRNKVILHLYDLSDHQPIFTGFDLSRISDTMTVSPGVVVSTNAAWVAPEVKAQGFANADKRSDVYALCGTLRLLFENTSDLAAQDAILTLMLGLEAKPDQRQSLEAIASGLDDKPTVPPPMQPLPPARYWSEGQEVEFNQKRFQIVSRLSSGSHGTTFKVEEIDGDQVVGCFAAKVVFDKTGGERALKAFRSARLPSCETPYLATICDTAPRWEENHFEGRSTNNIRETIEQIERGDSPQLKSCPKQPALFA